MVIATSSTYGYRGVEEVGRAIGAISVRAFRERGGSADDLTRYSCMMMAECQRCLLLWGNAYVDPDGEPEQNMAPPWVAR